MWSDSLASELPFAFLKSKLKCPITTCFWICTIPLAALRPAHGSRGFKGDAPFAQMGVFSGGVPLRQENALLSYGFSVQNSHWAGTTSFAQGCASLTMWNSLLNRLYSENRAVWISIRTDSRSSPYTHCTSGMYPSHGSRGQSRWQALPASLRHRCRADNDALVARSASIALPRCLWS